jgi:ADP-heptose:LPS heptosyltransferase
VLERCLAGDPPAALPPELLEESCAAALFSVVVEGLADRFEPALCDIYARLFSKAIAHAAGEFDAAALEARYRRVRSVRAVTGEPGSVFVLSRVTLGADVAITSVLLNAAKRRFPRTRIFFVGPQKNYELFAGDPRLEHASVAYQRGSLRSRLAVRSELRAMFGSADALVLDPDSRLTQLGLLPICPEERYRLFESRAYGGGGCQSLPELAAAWAAETLQVHDARPYLALPALPPPQGITVSLGVGENPAKRLADPFEEKLLSLLAATGLPLTIDKGAGGEEAERVENACRRAGIRATFWDGSFAGFAALIAASRLYVGYDSAGQHVAAAAGTPLISIFAGFPVPRMFDRWRPITPSAHAIRIDHPHVEATLARVREALAAAHWRPHEE